MLDSNLERFNRFKTDIDKATQAESFIAKILTDYESFQPEPTDLAFYSQPVNSFEIIEHVHFKILRGQQVPEETINKVRTFIITKSIEITNVQEGEGRLAEYLPQINLEDVKEFDAMAQVRVANGISRIIVAYVSKRGY